MIVFLTSLGICGLKRNTGLHSGEVQGYSYLFCGVIKTYDTLAPSVQLGRSQFCHFSQQASWPPSHKRIILIGWIHNSRLMFNHITQVFACGPFPELTEQIEKKHCPGTVLWQCNRGYAVLDCGPTLPSHNMKVIGIRAVTSVLSWEMTFVLRIGWGI